MKKKKNDNTKNAILSGPNIYQDKHGNTIYYNKRKNIAYKILADKEGTFRTYQSRYVIALIAFILFYILFKLNIFLSIGLTVVIGGFLEYRYRSFLKKAPQSVGFVKQEKVKPIDQMIELSANELMVRIFLYLALAILLVVNTFVSKNVSGNKPLIVVSYIIAVFAAFIGFKYISLMIRKKSK